jgi:hypothetical protein
LDDKQTRVAVGRVGDVGNLQLEHNSMSAHKSTPARKPVSDWRSRCKPELLATFVVRFVPAAAERVVPLVEKSNQRESARDSVW